MKMAMIINNFRYFPSLFLLVHFTLICLLITPSMSSSELSPSQMNTMLSLSKLVGSQISSIPWNPSTDPCTSWPGVNCTNNSTPFYVTSLSFSNFGLTNSSFLPLACQIESLEHIDVSKNKLSSIPPEFFTICGEVPGLKFVNFSFNSINSPLYDFSTGFSGLESLDLSYNLFYGSIGLQLNDLLGLKGLNLNFNHFNGSFPVKLGKLMALERLQLSGNSLQGPIPKEIGDYRNLTTLDLSKNQLTGVVPYAMRQLSKLEVLSLSENSLVGEVPGFIFEIKTLQKFAANQNNFTGAVPSGILRFLKNLDLSYNYLNGSIPKDLLSQPNLLQVDLSSNKLSGSIPRNLSSSLIRLRLGSNELNGTIQQVNCAELHSLMYLELEDNLLSGKIPAELGSCRSLRLLSLGGNNFSGELPLELGNLKELQGLELQQNNLVGGIPDEISKLSKLSILNFSSNSLNGSIPPSISRLTNLESMHLQCNNLSGEIPGNISDMTVLFELQLGHNHLSGHIPSFPQKLQYALNLSNNLFEGPIPASISSLASLEILDLSKNRFSGNIPQFLTQMPSLTTLLLDYNNFSGDIPTFRSFVAANFTGNPLLKTATPATHSKHTQRKKLGPVVIIAAIAAAVGGGLIAISVIFFSRRLLYGASGLPVQPDDEGHPVSQHKECRVLTSNSLHKSSIDFTRVMETVADPLNLVLKTKFSSYHKVFMPSGICYFVKKLSLRNGMFQPGSLENFGQKLWVLGKVNSSNIMTPLAYMLDGDNAYLFYEMTFKGNLFDLLHGNSRVLLDWASRFSIAVGVAQGLACLHGCSSGPILHFNLTSKTIMLKTLKDPQIGDIEQCTVIDPSKSTSSLPAVAGSVGYIPPEYAYTMRVTMMGNVYSFGVILLELVTGKQAVSDGTELAKWVTSTSGQQKWNRILDSSISQTTPAVRSQMLAVLKVALACIDVSSETRPKMKRVLRMLLNAR